MGNYVSMCRSNYFAVKDLAKFREWVNSFTGDLALLDDVADGPLVGICDGTEGMGWPQHRYEEDDTGDYKDIDFLGELAGHLARGHVAVLVDIGHDKLRYLVGEAIAVNSQGTVRRVRLIDDIMRKARRLGKNVTWPEY